MYFLVPGDSASERTAPRSRLVSLNYSCVPNDTQRWFSPATPRTLVFSVIFFPP